MRSLTVEATSCARSVAMHGLFCRVIYDNALLKFEEEHVSGVVSHEIHVQKAIARTYSRLVDRQQRLLVVNGAVFVEPGVEILHAPQAERERCSSLRTN